MTKSDSDHMAAEIERVAEEIRQLAEETLSDKTTGRSYHERQNDRRQEAASEKHASS